MRRAIKSLAGGLMVALLAGLALTQSGCRRSAEVDSPLSEMASDSASRSSPQAALATAASSSSSVMIYIKLVIDKEFNFLARTVGGKRNHTWQRVEYDAANAWWDNPLIVFADPPMPVHDVVCRDTGPVITGQVTSDNLTVQVKLIPNAEVAVRTDPPSDGIRGTITINISAVAEYFDGQWTQMVHESDRKLTFRFDTLDPDRRVEKTGREDRTVPTFDFERYTRDEVKWEPRSDWPTQPVSGDWRVVIYGRAATFDITSYRYVSRRPR